MFVVYIDGHYDENFLKIFTPFCPLHGGLGKVLRIPVEECRENKCSIPIFTENLVN
jgi:hypothetical protein